MIISDSEEDDWLKVGKSYKPPPQLVIEFKDDNLQQTNETNQKKQKKDKKDKKDKKEKKDKKKSKKSMKDSKIHDKTQLILKVTQDQIDQYYDHLIETKYNIDVSKGFLYNHDMGPGCLSVSMIPFGDEKIYLYGHQVLQIPSYDVTYKNYLLGLFKNEMEYPRYINYNQSETNFQISVLDNFQTSIDQEFIPYCKYLVEKKQINKDLEVSKRNLELQQQIQQNPDNFEAWKELINLQDKISEIQQDKFSSTKKLAIINKLEQSSEILSDHPWVITYKIQLLQSLELSDDEYHRQVNILFNELIQKYTHIKSIWILYLNHQIITDNFTATYLRIQSQKLLQMLQQQILNATRAQLVVLYKKIYIELIQQICFYEMEMGYVQKSIGILQSLIELNLFAPQELSKTYDVGLKIDVFKDYWEDYTNLKTGELNDKFGWIDQPQINDSYIGHFKKATWRPANQNFDNIEDNIDSLVLYEDIEPYLQVFNDNESKLQLINCLLNQLGFPSVNDQVLPQINDYHTSDLCLKDFKYENNYDLMIKYQSLLKYDFDDDNLSKFIYVKRLLKSSNEQLKDPRITQYLLIMYSCLYLNPALQGPNETLQREIQQAYPEIKEILKQNQNKIYLWLIFTEIESMKGNNYSVIVQSIKKFATKKKQRLMVLHYQFQKYISNHEECSKILDELLLLYDIIEPNEKLRILKLRKLIGEQKNKYGMEIFQNKKLINPYPLSKKSILICLLLYFEQYLTSQHLHFIKNEMKQLETAHFKDQQLKAIILQKYKNEQGFVLTQILKFNPSLDILSLDPNLFLIYNNIPGLYFLQIEKLQNYITINEPIMAWMISYLMKDQQKLNYCIELLRQQAMKTITEIYCRQDDQEQFQILVFMKYIYCMSVKLAESQTDVSTIYDLLKRHPYSRRIYCQLLGKITMAQWDLQIAEKELKV